MSELLASRNTLTTSMLCVSSQVRVLEDDVQVWSGVYTSLALKPEAMLLTVVCKSFLPRVALS